MPVTPPPVVIDDFALLTFVALFVVSCYYIDQRRARPFLGKYVPKRRLPTLAIAVLIVLAGGLWLAASVIDPILSHYLVPHRGKPEPLDASQVIYQIIFFGPITAATIPALIQPRNPAVRKPILSTVCPAYLTLCVFLPLVDYVPLQALDYPALSGALFGLVTASAWIGLFQSFFALLPDRIWNGKPDLTSQPPTPRG